MSGSKITCVFCRKIFSDQKGLSIHHERCKGKRTRTNVLRNARTNIAKRKMEYEGNPGDLGDFGMDLYDDSAAPALLDAPPELPAGTKRQKRLPKKFKDHLPSVSSGLPLASLPHFLDHAPPEPEPVVPVPEPQPERQRFEFTTNSNEFGVFRVYPDRLSDEPDNYLGLDELCDSPNLSVAEKNERQVSLPKVVTNIYAPFDNASTFLVTGWVVQGSGSKTYGEANRLVHEVIRHPDFKPSELKNYDASYECNKLLTCPASNNEEYGPETPDGWRSGSVRIKLPAEDGKSRAGESRAPEFEISGIHYRSLTETIICALDDPETPPFHYVPYKEYWNPPYSEIPERVYGELYGSDVWLEAHKEIRSKPTKDGLENFVLPIMLYSDSTHLANFGNASLWPLYMFLGSQSKLVRGKATENVCHHLAYIPSLPASVQDAYMSFYGRTASAEALTHLKRELMHAVLKLVLFRPEFLGLYSDGLPFVCSDGFSRRLFPRFMVYSADYPERMLVATLRNLGQHPCASCLIHIDNIHEFGTKENEDIVRVDDPERLYKIERARKLIFESGKGVESKVIKNILSDQSLIPVSNAFSILGDQGFNFFDLFVPDLMHEFELGVWKSLLTHLIRILCAQGGDTVSTFNTRFRLIPTFGNNTIRRFSKNTASLTKLAARDFEDILTCILPVFEGLLTHAKHSETVQDLLFDMANWHALAKLRQHTETTVNLLEEATEQLGRQLRYFKKTTCEAYDTRELQKEVIARGRRRAAMIVKKGTDQLGGNEQKQKAKRKLFNMNTPKVHSLGKYARKIRRFGTTDSFSTQIGEAQHKRIKRLYGRTNKKNAARDISTLEGRVREYRKIERRVTEASTHQQLRNAQEQLPKTSPEVHHHIAASRKDWIHLYYWLNENESDPALNNFLTRLRAHLLSRILLRDEEADFSRDEINRLRIKNNRLYQHKVFRVNFTTYDLRRVQDSLNTRTHPDVMMLSEDPESGHPYLYARIIKVFHAEVGLIQSGSTSCKFERMDILWVRWFKLDSTHSCGFSAKRLPRIQFVMNEDPDAFGFVNPDCIVRGAHFIPCFEEGRTKNLLPQSLARCDSENDEDYLFYNVNIFVDRDMFMRYRGGGVGHTHLSGWHANLLGENLKMTIEEEIEGADDAVAEENVPGVATVQSEGEAEEIVDDDGSEGDEGDDGGDDDDEEEEDEGEEGDGERDELEGYAEL